MHAIFYSSSQGLATTVDCLPKGGVEHNFMFCGVEVDDVPPNDRLLLKREPPSGLDLMGE